MVGVLVTAEAEKGARVDSEGEKEGGLALTRRVRDVSSDPSARKPSVDIRTGWPRVPDTRTGTPTPLSLRKNERLARFPFSWVSDARRPLVHSHSSESRVRRMETAVCRGREEDPEKRRVIIVLSAPWARLLHIYGE